MTLKSCMKRRVISASPYITLRAAAHILIENHIGSLPIVDDQSRLIGFLSIRDLIALAMPDFVNLIDRLDFIRDFGAVEQELPDAALLDMPVVQIMHQPIYLTETSGMIRALALLHEHKISDLPVVDDQMHLVGIASYVDIGVALMRNWETVDPQDGPGG
ncbi:MAG: CBS domain-containing protein [Anaerolineaceae bacterium]